MASGRSIAQRSYWALIPTYSTAHTSSHPSGSTPRYGTPYLRTTETLPHPVCTYHLLPCLNIVQFLQSTRSSDSIFWRAGWRPGDLHPSDVSLGLLLLLLLRACSQRPSPTKPTAAPDVPPLAAHPAAAAADGAGSASPPQSAVPKATLACAYFRRTRRADHGSEVRCMWMTVDRCLRSASHGFNARGKEEPCLKAVLLFLTRARRHVAWGACWVRAGG